MGPHGRAVLRDRRRGFPVPAVRFQRAPMVVLIAQARPVPRASEKQPLRARQFETGRRTESHAAYFRRRSLRPMMQRDAKNGNYWDPALTGAISATAAKPESSEVPISDRFRPSALAR